MGIKGLWTVLSPFSEKKSLHEIHGETLAIDLSGWVCDSQNVTDYYVQPKLYLRNLFFRTVYLLLSDVNPIFVLEGDAPELKQDVMAARNAIQFRGAAPKGDTATQKKPDTGRRRFKGVQRECESLLKVMGVCCVKGSGEAEATCAELNDQGLVDAVISQDSDCFAYGAQRVYRNFSVSSAAGGGALQGSIDCYDAGNMFRSNGFGRQKMVALALLCGCDYGPGACGSSITTAVAFLHTVPENDIIPRLVSWISDSEHYDNLSRWVSAPGRCDRCGHVGRTHPKNGCPVCATHKGCNDLGHKAKVADVKRELSLRSRALSCGMLFPNPNVMKEFLKRTPDDVDVNSLKKPPPSLIQFVKLMSHKLDWSERYSVEKFLPLLTKWHLQEKVPCRTIKPVLIKKKRKPKGVPSFEVVWEDIDGQYEELIPDDQYEENEDRSVPWTSIERQDLMRQYYPELVVIYEESIKKPSKEKKTRGRKKKGNEEQEQINKPERKNNRKPKTTVETLNDSFQALSVNTDPNPTNVHVKINKSKRKIKNDIENINDSLKVLNVTTDMNVSKLNISVKVNKLKRKIKDSKKRKQKTIDSFIAKKQKLSTIKSLRNSIRNISIHNDNISLLNDKENVNPNWLSMFDKSAEEIPECDLSDIVDDIISKTSMPKTVKLNNNLVRLVFDVNVPKKSILKGMKNNCSTPKDSPIRRKSVVNANLGSESLLTNFFSKANTSYFFDKLTEERDAFEMSIEHKSAVVNFDCDTTVDYSLPDVIM